MSERAYKVEPTKGKCSHCESENVTYFDVIGPDGYAQGTTFAEEVDAEEHANALNCAYELGRNGVSDLVTTLKEARQGITCKVAGSGGPHGIDGFPFASCACWGCETLRQIDAAIAKAEAQA